MITIDSSGYFINSSGDRFIPVGANYWPGSCGVEMWQVWPEDEIFADLDLMSSLGFNTVRFFVRWPDFEPRIGEYDDTMLSHLTRFLDACIERGLHPQPSLFVGWMSGGIFWPPWKTDTQNLFSDPVMLERGATYARLITTHFKPFATHLCGIDLGNELNALPDSFAASPAQVHEWCRSMTDAIRAVLPDVLILSGCDHQQVIADTGWRFGKMGRDASAAQPGIDVLTMHGYPVPSWHPVPLRGLGDPFTASLLPFYVKCARAFGPVMLQEFGTILGSPAAASQATTYLRTMLPACQAAGANGFLWWCFRDISARVHPYVKNHFESELGLVDAEGRVKKGLLPFIEFVRTLVKKPTLLPPPPPPPPAANVAVYFPRHYYDRNEPENPGNRPSETARRMLIAHHMLERSGATVRIIRGDCPIPSTLRRLVVAGASLDLEEIETLHLWVERDGGHLLWHGPNPHGWASAATRLIGAAIADYRSETPVEARSGGRIFRFPSHPLRIRVVATPLEAEVMLRDDTGLPIVFRRRLGQGTVTCALPDVEAAVLDQFLDGQNDEDWIHWYSKLLGIDQSAKAIETTHSELHTPCETPSHYVS